MPNKTWRFHLYSDTSKYATGSALYQIQGGKPKLIAYARKRLPEAAKITPSQNWNCVDWLSIQLVLHIYLKELTLMP